MADMDFSQAFTYSDINKVYLMAVELSGGLVSQHGSVQLERIFQDSTLYAQVSALKNEMESILQNFTGASEYDDTATYAVGDYCTKDDYLYQCNTAVSAESWDASKWDVVTISSQYTMLKNILGVDDYSTSASYAVDDLVVHGGKMYRCITAVSSEAWDASKWSETDFVTEVESAIAEIQAEGATQVANVQAVYAEDLGNVSSRVQSNSKRIANLIQKEGEVSVSYPDSIYGRGEVPANMAKFAEVKTLRGVSRVANQLFDYNDVTSVTINGLTITNNNDGSVTVNGTATSTTVRLLVPQEAFVVNHFYVVGGCPRGGSTSTYQITGIVNGSRYGIEVGDGSIIPMPSSFTSAGLYIYITSGTVCDNLVFKPMLRDLNIYFNTTDLSFLGATDSAKLSTIQQNYPELLVPSAYDAGSLVDITYSAVKSQGVNLWDEEYNDYYLTQSLLVSLNPIKVSAGDYYYKAPRYGYINLQDDEGNAVGSQITVYANSAFTVPQGTTRLSFSIPSYGSVYNHDVQICLNSYPDKTIYHPYMKSTLTLPSPVTLPSAGSVADTDELCVEVDGVEKRRQTRRVGSVDLGTDVSFQYDSSANRFYSTSLSATIGGETVSGRYKNTMLGSGMYELSMTGADKTYFVYTSNKILYIYDNSKTASDLVSGKAPWLVGIKLYYELATPVVTLTDPILDNFLLTEAGGTITPIQDNTPEIDARFDMNYMAL